MSACVTLSEHGFLFKAAKPAAADGIAIGDDDFEAFRALLLQNLDEDAASAGQDDEAEDAAPAAQRLFRLGTRHGYEVLQVRNFVGVLEAPSGLQVEILPKVGSTDAEARALLMRMLRAGGWVPPLPTYTAALRAVPVALPDLFAAEFLQAVQGVVKRGVASGYVRTQTNGPYLKGRLVMAQHLRHNVVRAERFFTEHDHFTANRPENRLLVAALRDTMRRTLDHRNGKLARELAFALQDIPPSRDIHDDLHKCVRDRSLVHYQDALAWARMILLRLSPLGRQGPLKVRGLLFPMERVFERYVGRSLQRHARPPYAIQREPRRHSLVTHQDRAYFQLKPDFLLSHGKRPHIVLDAKWKLLDAATGANARKKYGLSQADLYQLYAYGRKYLPADAETRTVYLIYPRTEHFRGPLAPFVFEPGLTLHVMPFDLDDACLVDAIADASGVLIDGAPPALPQ